MREYSINEDVKQKMNRQDILLRRARRLKDNQSWRAYKNQRNLCNNAVRKAKATYHRNMLEENKLSPKKFWNVIKSIFPLRSKSSAFQLKDRVNEFSKYFSNVVTKMKMATYPLINFVWKYHKKEPKRFSPSRMSPLSSSKKNLEILNETKQLVPILYHQIY